MIRVPPKIVAHRGLHADLPENSLAAMCAAWDAGIEWCECDVHLSADEVPIVIHDDTLDRTTTGHGPVAGLPASTLRQLKLLDAQGNPTDHPLPLLADFLAKTGVGRALLVETKPLLGKRIYPIAKKIRKIEGMLQSFHAQDMLLARRATKNKCPVAMLSDTCYGHRAKNFPGGFHVHHESLTRASFNMLSHYGPVSVWTVNDPDEIRRLLQLGDIDMIITDNPLEVRRVLAEPLKLSYESIDPP